MPGLRGQRPGTIMSARQNRRKRGTGHYHLRRPE